MDYRHELKFLVTQAQIVQLRSRIEHIAKPDSHQTGEGYVITSLYFDDMKDSLYLENIQGVDKRHKYRLRIYDHNTDLIKLERKSKIHGMTAKTAVRIQQQDCRQMMDGRLPWILPEDSQTKKELLCAMKLAALRPKCIVQYLREAYIYPVGNVRITFDRNISGSRSVGDFLQQHIDTVPLLPENVHILEVKYDELLPGYLAEALEIQTLRQTAFSKYGHTREKLG